MEHNTTARAADQPGALHSGSTGTSTNSSNSGSSTTSTLVVPTSCGDSVTAVTSEVSVGQAANHKLSKKESEFALLTSTLERKYKTRTTNPRFEVKDNNNGGTKMSSNGVHKDGRLEEGYTVSFNSDTSESDDSQQQELLDKKLKIKKKDSTASVSQKVPTLSNGNGASDFVASAEDKTSKPKKKKSEKKNEEEKTSKKEKKSKKVESGEDKTGVDKEEEDVEKKAIKPKSEKKDKDGKKEQKHKSKSKTRDTKEDTGDIVIDTAAKSVGNGVVNGAQENHAIVKGDTDQDKQEINSKPGKENEANNKSFSEYCFDSKELSEKTVNGLVFDSNINNGQNVNDQDFGTVKDNSTAEECDVTAQFVLTLTTQDQREGLTDVVVTSVEQNVGSKQTTIDTGSGESTLPENDSTETVSEEVCLIISDQSLTAIQVSESFSETRPADVVNQDASASELPVTNEDDRQVGQVNRENQNSGVSNVEEVISPDKCNKERLETSTLNPTTEKDEIQQNAACNGSLETSKVTKHIEKDENKQIVTNNDDNETPVVNKDINKDENESNLTCNAPLDITTESSDKPGISTSKTAAGESLTLEPTHTDVSNSEISAVPGPNAVNSKATGECSEIEPSSKEQVENKSPTQPGLLDPDQTSSSNVENSSVKSNTRDYSSKSIKSIYFSEEFEGSSVDAGHESKMAEGGSDVTPTTNGDLHLDEESRQENNAAIKSTKLMGSDEKYERILSEVKSSDSRSESSITVTKQHSHEKELSSSSEKMQRTFSHESYEAAVQRAFAKDKTVSKSTASVSQSSEATEKQTCEQNIGGGKSPPPLSSSVKQEGTYAAEKPGNVKTLVVGGGRQSASAEESVCFGENNVAVRMAYSEDGRDTLERTTTFVAGDRHSTDELIKRILAESKGELATSRANRSRISSDTGSHTDSNLDHRGRPAEDSPLSPRQRSQPEMASERPLPSDRAVNAEQREPRRGMYTDEGLDTPATPSQPPAPHHPSPHLRTTLSPSNASDPHSDEGDVTGHQSSRRYRSGFMQKQAAIYDDYAATFRTAATRYAQHESDLSDEEGLGDGGRYGRRRAVARRQNAAAEYIADEEFIPSKAEDTDLVVQERTAEIRNVVDNQNQVLKRLKSANDSFDELQEEIRQIKQQFLDSAVRRAAILDDLEYEREQWEHEMCQATGTRPGPHGGGYERSRTLDFSGSDDYDPPQPSAQHYRPYSGRSQLSLDRELESDRIGSGALQNLAVKGAGAGLTAFGEDGDRIKSERGAYSSYSSTSKYSSTKQGRSASMFEDSAFDVLSGSRNRTGSRFAAQNCLDVADDDAESYTSPNLPSYRRYDAPSNSYTPSNKIYAGASNTYDKYSSLYSSESRGDYSRGYSARSNRDFDDDLSSASGESGSGRFSRSTNRGGFDRSATFDSYDSPSTSSYRNKYSGGATGGVGVTSGSASGSGGFSSRFLDKVRQKKAAGEEISRDKPFSSRFLASSSFDTSSASLSTSKSVTSSKARQDKKDAGGS